jgi:hypothetical protein
MIPIGQNRARLPLRRPWLTTPGRRVQFNYSASSMVSCQIPDRAISAWTFSPMRLMLFFDGNNTSAYPVFATVVTGVLAAHYGTMPRRQSEARHER